MERRHTRVIWHWIYFGQYFDSLGCLNTLVQLKGLLKLAQRALLFSTVIFLVSEM